MRGIIAIVHVVLAVPGVLLVGVALLALVLHLARAGSDPHEHGFATAIALAGGAVAAPPLVLYVWLLRRWWAGRGWLGLALADACLSNAAIALVAT